MHPADCYANRALARAVNVDATASLVRAAEKMPSPPRFVHASSMAVYGSRNPHRLPDLLTPDTPPLASELYGCHKLKAENIVRASALEWSMLRLAGVITLEPLVDYGDFDSFYFGSIMPEDNRCHSVDVRDVAAAFSAAITTDAVREIFMIAGDDSHKQSHREMAFASAEAIGTGACCFPAAREIPPATPTGIRWTGWTPHAPSRCCPFSGTRIQSPTRRSERGWVARRGGWV